MAQDILAKLRDSLLLRASVATVVGIVLLGVASGALPLTCFVGLAACGPGARVDAAGSPATAVTPAVTAVPKADPAKVSVKVAKVSPPTLTHNDVVAGSFAKLKVELSAPPGDSELKTRVVTTVAIGPDGQPQPDASRPAPAQPVKAATPAQEAVVPQVGLAADAAVAADAPADATMLAGGVAAAAATAVPAPVATTTVPTPTAKPRQPAATSEPAVAPASSKSAVIKGSGANAHDSPSKKSKVLFAFGPGETVTVSADSHGWLKVTDADGRSGWVWEELLTRK